MRAVGIELQRIGKGWRFQSREKYADFLRQLFRGKVAPVFPRLAGDARDNCLPPTRYPWGNRGNPGYKRQQ